APLRLQPADDVAVAIAEDGRRGARLAPLGDQDRAAYRVVEDCDGKAEKLQGRRDLAAEVDAQYRRALLDLAFGRDGDAAGKVGGKPAIVEIDFGGGDRGGAG